MSTTQGVKLDETTRNRLKELAKKRDRSPHWLMKTAIETYIDREEQYEREKSEDLQRWEQYALTGKAIDSNIVEPWLEDLAQGKVVPCPK